MSTNGNASQPSTVSDLTEFELRQYDWLRKEIEADTAETRLLERIALIGTGAIWAWLAAAGGDKLDTISQANKTFITAHPSVWLIPGLFALLGGLRCLVLLCYIMRRAAYIRKMEAGSKKTNDSLVGWETYIEKTSRAGKHIGLSITAYAFWVLLLVASIVVALSQGWLQENNGLSAMGIAILVSIVILAAATLLALSKQLERITAE